VIAHVDDELVHRDATGDRKTSADADGGAAGCRARHTVGVAEGHEGERRLARRAVP
jgi:hypothetical protein